jgi:antitoxin component HigA of HigAB toxin-antitoxin module
LVLVAEHIPTRPRGVTETLFQLSAKAHHTRAEENQIEPLTLLIEHYEEEHYLIPDASPADVLHFLIEQNGLSQRDLIPESWGTKQRCRWCSRASVN